MTTLNAMLNDALMQHNIQSFLEQAIPLLTYDVVNGKSTETNLDAVMRNALLESETDENEYMIKVFLDQFGEIASSMYDNDKTLEDHKVMLPKFVKEGEPKPVAPQFEYKVDENSRVYKAWLKRDTSVGKMSDFKVKLQSYIDSQK